MTDLTPNEETEESGQVVSAAPLHGETPTAAVRRRLLAGETLNAADVVSEYGKSRSFLQVILSGMRTAGYEVERTEEGSYRVAGRREPAEEALERPTADANGSAGTGTPGPARRSTPHNASAVLRERFARGDWLSSAEAEALGLKRGSFHSLVKRMTAEGADFEQRRRPSDGRVTEHRLRKRRESVLLEPEDPDEVDLVYPAFGSWGQVTGLTMVGDQVRVIWKQEDGTAWLTTLEGVLGGE